MKRLTDKKADKIAAEQRELGYDLTPEDVKAFAKTGRVRENAALSGNVAQAFRALELPFHVDE